MIKKILIHYNILLAMITIFAHKWMLSQNYFIQFTADGESTIIDSVIVENISKCEKIKISGSDVLNLTSSLSNNDNNFLNYDQARCIPNPFDESCIVMINAYGQTKAIVNIIDASGKIIFSKNIILEKGSNALLIQSLPMGLYHLEVISGTMILRQKLISFCLSSNTVNIQCNVVPDYPDGNAVKHSSNIIQMLYHSGDIIKLTGISGGIYKTVKIIKPTSNEIVNFTFVKCQDNNGNSYSVIKIGNQWWMAENLNAGVYAPITSPQQSGTKFCMNINGVADPSCPMGGLYEWYNLMQGASGCNGSGPPPFDRCPVPVRGLCPEGWHIPSHFEWITLLRNISSNPNDFPYNMSTGVIGTVEGGMLKDNCSNYWWPPNAGATNISGFSALPGGDTWQGVFEDYGQSAYFWTSTAYLNYSPWVYALNYTVPLIGRSFYVPENGFSCRCVKD
ncbi:MAG: T9SS type A sorting domain-containing protein [Bacteroidales bacterium]|nr:T9SS type A sorting domain-containing protein [Bacteroidales bacterium]